ncbi:class III extradiol dioxygenase subunit B-like domain-containing protein [Streptomyces orinoci]|uniref:Class III extradiol dioxygenase subunit B-like domain-containing protein n=1 Tax=Streptomyces orinoci TaxID=67339 RepID=A0ABV3K334_STRON|nr:class III extradiol dioxygenase subunit B-like domain-containing protein [Streptomyces orinoci]
MLVAAAVCPCPPLLVPEVAAGAAPELDPLRAACLDAVAVLAAARPDRLVVVGTGDGEYPSGTPGSFRGFGVDLDVRLGEGDSEDVPGTRRLPAPLAVSAWLLARTGWSAAPVTGLGVAAQAPPGNCLAVGRALAATDERLALLVMGDGSACRDVKAPGYLDERAEGFDAAAARALGAADTAALAALDPALATELQAAGRAPWQVLAGAGEGAGLRGALLYDQAPLGVGYLVAAWS